MIPLWAGFVVSLVAYRVSFASVRHSGSVCFGMIFSMFPGISLVISCIVDSLNLLGMPGFLLAGFMGRVGVSCRVRQPPVVGMHETLKQFTLTSCPPFIP